MDERRVKFIEQCCMLEEEEFGWILGVVLLMGVAKEDDVEFGMTWD